MLLIIFLLLMWIDAVGLWLTNGLVGGWFSDFEFDSNDVFLWPLFIDLLIDWLIDGLHCFASKSTRSLRPSAVSVYRCICATSYLSCLVSSACPNFVLNSPPRLTAFLKPCCWCVFRFPLWLFFSFFSFLHWSIDWFLSLVTYVRPWDPLCLSCLPVWFVSYFYILKHSTVCTP